MTLITILKLHFKDSLGKDRYIKIAKPKKGLDKETVQKAMQLMASAHLMQSEGTDMLAVPLGAKYVTTTEESVYSDKD
ncbi:DUF2922 domain-containing protein [Limosilactobacillus reuteri]|uniref:DUF2922 domain-containing protein n=1 Tax=Limosilactobacillus reuteri TaxID=1598 RepID=UPI000A2E3168|nr:DUF2922 domain-containing protein [Limosilactobacillus reuteri]MCH9394771.1 DUF2922 domain-containing protein [Limosilactobacillus reuteri]OTA48588.1 hypothetical protein BHL90_09120 [Limosilactobacillus reuteri]